ncbi:MAG: phage protein [Herbinix sp.]|nr:phage protein [Herbinix sp.]
MMEFLVKVGDKVYDISELVSKISFKDSLNEGCSTLEFTYVNQNLNITNGSVISFKHNSTAIFYGYVFKVSRGKGKEISVTAYDQLRYCKAKDTIVVQEDTVTNLATRMCNYFHLKKGSLKDTKYKLATEVKDDSTWLDIIYSGISDTLMNKGEWYLLRDEFGKICIHELKDLQLNLILGDESLVYDYKYNTSIDDEFYNQIKIFVKGETTKESEFVVTNDTTSVSKYGLLQYYETLDNSNAAKAKAKAEVLLRLYNKEVETLNLSCLGDTRIRAGSSFFGRIEDIEYNKRLIVKSVTHEFIPTHTMEVEAML